jgi:diguanylate cyclase (GGDEF)-like protein
LTVLGELRGSGGPQGDRRLGLLEQAEAMTCIGSLEWDITAERVTWSDGLHRVLGTAPGEFPTSLEAYLDFVHPNDREARRATIERVRETGQPSDGESRIVRRDGQVRWVDSRIHAAKNGNGDVARIVITCQDVTTRKHSERELERRVAAARAQALRDPLTGLANRTLALDRLDHALKVARRHGHDLAVLFVDVDGFKSVNDRHGHATGDRVLSAIADRFRATVRGSDTVARIGGDEFLVICEERGAADGVRTAERLCSAFALPFEVEGTAHEIPLSIGISIAPPKATTPKQMIAEADAAMYEVKRSGGGAYRIFTDD